MPYGFNQFLKFVGLVGFAILSYLAQRKGIQNEMFICGGLALLFQPFFKIALGKENWKIVAVFVGVVLLLSVFIKNRVIVEN